MATQTSADQLAASLKNIDKHSFSNPAERMKAQNALFAAFRRIQPPWEILWYQVLGDTITQALVQTLLDVEFFSKWVGAGGKPLSSAELAQLCGIDPELMKRILREVASQHLIDESELGDTYVMTDYCRALADPLHPAMFTLLYEYQMPAAAHFPKYAKKQGYKNPTDPATSNCVDWLNGTTFFEHMKSKPEVGDAFNKAMTLYANAKTPWLDIYPTDELVKGAKESKPVLVDVAGGMGQDIERLRAKHPDLPKGSLVLQDQPQVVADAKVASPIKAQSIDLFKPQPIQGAAAYYMHIVLHDFPDVQATEILKNIAVAMEKGYSRILLHEVVLHAKNRHPLTAISDITMMFSFSAQERTEGQWKALVESAGLKVQKIYTTPHSTESVLELVLA